MAEQTKFTEPLIQYAHKCKFFREIEPCDKTNNKYVYGCTNEDTLKIIEQERREIISIDGQRVAVIAAVALPDSTESSDSGITHYIESAVLSSIEKRCVGNGCYTLRERYHSKLY